MKKHSLFKVVMITVAIAVLLSWLLPITYVDQSGVVEGERLQIGIFEVMSYVGISVQAFSSIAIYVLIIGGLYGILHKISGYRHLLDHIVKGFRGHEWIFLSVVSLILALLSSMAGLSLAILAFFPFVISVILMMGYDKITAAMTTLGSVAIGLIGTVFSRENTAGIDAVLGTTSGGDAWLKIALFVISFALLLVNLLIYAKKHRDTKNLVEGSYIPEKTTQKESYWPIVVIMDLLFVLLILAFVSWDVLGVRWFQTVFTKITEYEINGFPIFGAILGLGENSYFGYWTLVEASVVLLLASWLLSFIYRMKFNDYVTSFMNGAKRALKPAVLIILAYLVLVITNSVPTLLTVFKPMLELTKGLNIVIMSVVSFFASMFSVDSYYTAIAVLPCVTTLYTEMTAGDITVLSLLCQAMYGLAMLAVPTSVVLVATLGYLHIPYGKWLKSIWLLFLELFAAILAILAIIMLTI